MFSLYGICIAVVQVSIHADCCSGINNHAVLILSAEGVNC